MDDEPAGHCARSRRPRREKQSAALDLGDPDAPDIRHRRAGVCSLLRSPTGDRHAARSRGHPHDPSAPRPLAFGAKYRPSNPFAAISW